MTGLDRWFPYFLLAGGAIALRPATAVAQADSARWQEIPVHARVRVTTPGAREIRGTLVEWTDSSLTIRTPPEVMIGLHQIERLRVARGNHLGRGLLLGVGTGIMTGVIFGLAVESSGEGSRGTVVLVSSAVFGALAGGIGALAGALTVRWSDVAVPNR